MEGLIFEGVKISDKKAEELGDLKLVVLFFTYK